MRFRCSSFFRSSAAAILIEFLYGNTSFVAVVVNPAAEADLYVKIGGKRIDNRRTDTVQTAAWSLYALLSNLPPAVQGLIKQRRSAGTPFSMHADRDSAAVVSHGRRAVCFKCYVNGVAVGPQDALSTALSTIS